MVTVICLGVLASEWAVGFYYAFGTNGGEEDLLVRIVPSSVIMFIVGIFFAVSGLLVVRNLYRGGRYRAGNSAAKTHFRLAVFILLNSALLIFAGGFVYAYLNVGWISTTEGNMGVRTTWYFAMCAISTCNVWIFWQPMAVYQKRKANAALSSVSTASKGGSGSDDDFKKIELCSCMRKGGSRGSHSEGMSVTGVSLSRSLSRDEDEAAATAVKTDIPRDDETAVAL